MIPFDFEYFKPKNIQETVALFHELKHTGKTPSYFSGGTEIITLGRLNIIYADAVIDLKGIPEYRILHDDQNQLIMGAGLSLVEVEETNKFPLLTKTASEIADHTARVKITLGGNVCANIYYREAVLPFLVSDSQVTIAGFDGVKTVPINQIFNQELKLNDGEFLVHVSTDRRFIDAPYISIKRRKQWNTGYPLVTVVALKLDNQIRVAISGLCPFPFRSSEMEAHLNNNQLTIHEKVNQAIRQLPSPILDDVEGSAEYRLFVLKNTLLDILMELKGE